MVVGELVGFNVVGVLLGIKVGEFDGDIVGILLGFEVGV